MLAAGAEARAKAGMEDDKPPRSANVEVMEATVEDVTPYIVLTGETAPIKDVTYAAEAAGSLDYLAPLGEKVIAGDLLARVDYKMLKAQADQARSAYNLAYKTYKRYTSLQDDDLVSRQMLDEAYSRMSQARAQKKMADTNLANSKVAARFGGEVAARWVEEGEYVGPGTPLLRVVDLSTILVEAQVPERHAASVDVTAPVSVTVDCLCEDFEGKVDVLVPVSDPKSKTYLLRIEIDNPRRNILSGMAAKIKIATGPETRPLLFPATRWSRPTRAGWSSSKRTERPWPGPSRSARGATARPWSSRASGAATG